MRKRLLLVPDGMADDHLEELGGKTPLQAAHTPAMDALAQRGAVGLVQTVPDGMPPGSDVAILSVLGYDARALYTGRSPLEAANIGVDLGADDVAYRCNFVTIDDGVMRDNTAGHIDNATATGLVAALEAALGGGPFEFSAGVGYRNLLVWRGGEQVACTPPHDILNQPVAGFAPRGAAADALIELAGRAHDLLEKLRPATDVWFWGEGRAPNIPPFRELYGLSGAVAAAVDLVRGLGRYAGFEVLAVPGATGDIDTDYGAKARAAADALARHDFVFVHVEAPDEAAHMGDVAAKIAAIERIDAEVLAPLAARPELAMLVLPDHFTPVQARTHTGAPVPFVFAGCAPAAQRPAHTFDEETARTTGLTFADGPALMRWFIAATA
jgi:2,3-bisphosphoglycerate-independent phosphoglycerate mutase